MTLGGVIIDKLNQIAEMRWTVLVKYTVHDEGGEFEGYTLTDRKPVKFFFSMLGDLYMGKPSATAVGQLTRPTQPFVVSSSCGR